MGGLGDADLYLKKWTTLPAIQAANGWEILAQPGLLAVKSVGKGQIVACQLDPEKLGPSRGRIKALRFWNLLLANLKVQRDPFGFSPGPDVKVWEKNPWEDMPPYFDW